MEVDQSQPVQEVRVLQVKAKQSYLGSQAEVCAKNLHGICMKHQSRNCKFCCLFLSGAEQSAAQP